MGTKRSGSDGGNMETLSLSIEIGPGCYWMYGLAGGTELKSFANIGFILPPNEKRTMLEAANDE